MCSASRTQGVIAAGAEGRVGGVRRRVDVILPWEMRCHMRSYTCPYRCAGSLQILCVYENLGIVSHAEEVDNYRESVYSDFAVLVFLRGPPVGEFCFRVTFRYYNIWSSVY